MFEIYTDGSSTGKVGEGGWAFVITKQGVSIYETQGGADNTTNNRMELSAVIEALQHMYNAYPSNTPIVIYSDSQYVIKGINEWFPNGKKQLLKVRLLKIKIYGSNIKNLWICLQI